jgi:hypothetical protein
MEIGEPTRTIIVEPIEDPVPREQPERRPEEEPAPASPMPEKAPA